MKFETNNALIIEARKKVRRWLTNHHKQQMECIDEWCSEEEFCDDEMFDDEFWVQDDDEIMESIVRCIGAQLNIGYFKVDKEGKVEVETYETKG